MNNLGRASLVKSKVASLGIPKSYQRLGGFPLDDSTVFATIEERDAMVSGVRYAGMISYVEATEEIYILKGGIENSCWTALAAGDKDNNINSYVIDETNGIEIGQFVYLSSNNTIKVANMTSLITNSFNVLGVAIQAGQDSESILVQEAGQVQVLVSDISESGLIYGKSCFLHDSGKIVGSDKIKELPLLLNVGTAINNNTILLNIDNDPILIDKDV